MIKPGIVDAKDMGSRTPFFKRKKKVAIPLILEGMRKSPASQLDRNFNDIKLGNTYKKTAANRFGDIDDTLVRLIKERGEGGRRLVIGDLAVSSGITSCEFYRKLTEAGLSFEFFATDKFTHLYCVRSSSSGWVTVLDSNNDPVQYVGHGFVLSEPESCFDLVNRLLLGLLQRNNLPEARQAVLEHFGADRDFSYCERSDRRHSIARYPLLHRDCLELTASGGNYTFLNGDVFAPLARRCDVVRAMNILNLDYFDRARLALAVRHVADGLNEQGLFIVGRSQDEASGRHNVSIFQKQGVTLRHLMDINDGSEIKDIVAGHETEN